MHNTASYSSFLPASSCPGGQGVFVSDEGSPSIVMQLYFLCLPTCRFSCWFRLTAYRHYHQSACPKLLTAPPPPRCTWPVVTASTWWQALSAEVAVSAVKGAICQMFQRSNGEFGSTAFTILLPDGAGSRNCFLQLHVLPAYAANSGAHGSACVSELLLIEGKPPVEVEAGPSNDQAVDHHDLILL